MSSNPLLENTPTEALISRYGQVEGMMLAALAQADQAETLALRRSHRAESDAFVEQLQMLFQELWARAENFDPLANNFVSERDTSTSIYRAAG